MKEAVASSQHSGMVQRDRGIIFVLVVSGL
jgi:hypothetical protein